MPRMGGWGCWHGGPKGGRGWIDKKEENMRRKSKGEGEKKKERRT